MTNLTIIRKASGLGRLYIDGQIFCFTLDPCKLTDGIYNVEITYSPKFEQNLPLIYNDEFVASRGFRIHAGNTLADSNGWILVGNTAQEDLWTNNIVLLNSKTVLKSLMDKIDKKCTLTILTK